MKPRTTNFGDEMLQHNRKAVIERLLEILGIQKSEATAHRDEFVILCAKMSDYNSELICRKLWADPTNLENLTSQTDRFNYFRPLFIHDIYNLIEKFKSKADGGEVVSYLKSLLPSEEIQSCPTIITIKEELSSANLNNKVHPDLLEDINKLANDEIEHLHEYLTELYASYVYKELPVDRIGTILNYVGVVVDERRRA